MSKAKQNRTLKEQFLSVGFPFILAIILVFIVQAKVFTPVKVSNSFMEPTFQKGETLYINRLIRTKNLLIGDVVLARSPIQSDGYILARILGKAGDEIQISAREAFRNGAVLSSDVFPMSKKQTLPVLPEGKSASDHKPKFIIPEKSVFLLVDNREMGIDSRELGPIPEENIIGKVW